MKRRNFIKSAGLLGTVGWVKNVYVQPKINPVTDPEKIVTDPTVISMCNRIGVDKDYVEFFGDYLNPNDGNSPSPYCKFYRNLLSKNDEQIMVSSGLPMRRKNDGEKLDIRWLRVGNEYHNMFNLFDAVVDGTQINVTILNDQPYGVAKQYDSMTYQPRLFVGGVEKLPVSAIPTLLPLDPTNPDLVGNTLEWDYGICKRRLRVIQGRINGYWLFPQNPGKDVRIVYNRSGELKLRLGNAQSVYPSPAPIAVSVMNEDEEFITAESLSKAIYPLRIGDSATYYPDADAESTSVDGRVGHAETQNTWATIRNAAGSVADDSDDYIYMAYIASGVNLDKWTTIYRGPSLFDSSGLPDGCTISAGTLSYYGYGVLDDLSITPDVNVYECAPATSTELVAGDYDSFSDTALCDSAIAYGSWNTGTPGTSNDFALNASGLALISKTGISKFGGRNASYDVANNPPSHTSNVSSYVLAWSADKGVGYKPKLVVTYSESGWTGTAGAVTDPSSLSTIPVSLIDKVSTVP